MKGNWIFSLLLVVSSVAEAQDMKAFNLYKPEEDGSQLHIQNSAYLEEGEGSTGYNKEKVMEFFQHWSPKALDAAQYKNF